ncbi:putative ABC transporter substrate-binding protein YesO [Bombiscardovia nodaiensis]|uniref:ABC transporter substrate-binding protein YesO n=1 Tax=Bombiscardovia nodaiensis TaxID=2932181 RepID=A0ABN6S8R4_9BIFI|nr:putative ABC transporter substrate-binding protein YesO [Bombiscardovia nodaiensis]
MMKHLSRAILASFTATIMLFVGACGSGGSKQSESDQHLTISWWGNQERNERTKKINDMFMKENKGVKIDGQFSEFSDYYQKLSVGAAGKTMPDIMQIDLNHFAQFEKNGLLLDLQKYEDSKVIDLSNVEKDIVKQGKLDGGMYNVTAATNAPALVYNKTLLDKLGITIPKNMNIKQFEDISRQVQQKSGYKTNFRYYEPSDQLAYMLRAKGEVLYNEHKLGVKSASELEPYFQVYADGIKEGWHLDPQVFTELKVASVEQDPLVYGTDPSRMSWCSFRWSSQYVAYTAIAPKGVELAMTSWPSDNVKKSNYLKPSLSWTISKTCKNPDLAAKWINFYVNNVEANKVLLTDRGVPISSKVLEAIKPSLTQPDQYSIDFIQKEITPNSSPINPPAPAGASEVDSKVLPSVEEELCYQKISVKEAAQRFFDQANQALSTAR